MEVHEIESEAGVYKTGKRYRDFVICTVQF